MSEQLNFLIIDRARSDAQLSRHVFEKLGFLSVDIACDRREIASCLDATDYDCVLVNFPASLDGLSELFEQISSVSKNCQVIVSYEVGDKLQGQDQVRYIADAHDLVLVGIVAKPILVHEAESVLANVQSIRKRAGGKSKETPFTVDEILAGIKQDRIFPVFQPKVSIPDGKLVGLEVLARWKTIDGEIKGPHLFIPVAEENGIITEITKDIIRKSMEIAGEWRIEGRDVKISVNVSMDDLESRNFDDWVLAVIEESGVDPSRVVLEVTESKLLKDIKTTIKALAKLRSKGIGLSIDDFGTGYSSLEQLQRMPFTELKIDRAFVYEAWKDKDKRVILEHSVSMARSLGLSIVAEGAETIEDWRILESLSADLCQGFYSGRPLAAEDLNSWEADWEKRKPNPLKQGAVISVKAPSLVKSAVVVVGLIVGGLLAREFFFDPLTATHQTDFMKSGNSVVIMPFESKQKHTDALNVTLSNALTMALVEQGTIKVITQSGDQGHAPVSVPVSVPASAPVSAPVSKRVGTYANLRGLPSASHSVSGDFEHLGDSIIVRIKIENLSDNSVIHAQTMRRDVRDINSSLNLLSGDIAKIIVDTLDRPFVSERLTRDVSSAALSDFAAGVKAFRSHTKEGYRQAQIFFEKAVSDSPAFDKAFSWLGLSYLVDGSYVKARIAVTKAQELEPNNALSYAVQARLQLESSQSFDGVVNLFEKAINLQPSQSEIRSLYADSLSLMGAGNRAVDQASIALELAPANPHMASNLALYLHYIGHDDEAITLLEEVLRTESASVSDIKIADWRNQLFKAYINAKSIAKANRLMADILGTTGVKDSAKSKQNSLSFWYFLAIAHAKSNSADVEKYYDYFQKAQARGQVGIPEIYCGAGYASDLKKSEDLLTNALENDWLLFLQMLRAPVAHPDFYRGETFYALMQSKKTQRVLAAYLEENSAPWVPMYRAGIAVRQAADAIK